MFRPVVSSVSFPQLELQIAEFWKRQAIYEKSLAQRADAPAFVFFEGPPTANGLPHPGHCLTRAIKDLFPRYRTMRGYRCDRKAGWDTHGLPVEVEVCKELGIHSKEEIEAYGVEKFIHLCLESVFRYTKEWERLTERLGFWIHLDQAYVTYHQSYVESVWWALAELFNRGLLYQGHKIVWWWAQGGTALSSGEVGQGYREVADPSVYVRFPLVDPAPGLEDTDLLVWTTTPWTLPSNQYAAVHPELDYAVVRDAQDNRRLIIAAALVETIAAKVGRPLTIEATLKGINLLELRYRPPFDYYYARWADQQGELLFGGGRKYIYWRVVSARFVTTESGTGVVHQAPAFGEVDYDVLLFERAKFGPGAGPELLCAVAPDGKFTAEATDFAGRWVKEADKDIARNLRHRGLLYHQEQYLHEYPFCWRAEQDPLIQYPRRSWFIRTSQYKDRMLANNQQINWLPEHIKEGRFGNFLETNVDWALSRERYWGTPLPIWVCEKTGHMEAVSNYPELLKKPGLQGTDAWTKAKAANPTLSEHLKVHKPYIDEVTYQSPKDSAARMRRVPDVIDCWFDSGAMPFAQWGYPHQPGSVERFQQQFPADFISEALDQTRGWFYSQLAISTLLFGEGESDSTTASGKEGESQIANCKLQNETTNPQSAIRIPHFPYPHPFKNCIVLGLMLAEWWETNDGKQRFLSETEARDAMGSTSFARKIGKMSKQLRNYRPPEQIFDTYGADALRWYFFANQAPWNSIIYSEQAIKESIPEFLLRLWNVYSFFVIYANIDGFDPAALLGDYRSAGGSPTPTGEPPVLRELTSDMLAKAASYSPVSKRSELDRWILSELNRTAAEVTERMDAYDNFAACSRITAFVDALSNWYVRRSRDRFWSSEQSADKRDAYWTLYECLLTTSKLVAPFVPFLAEALWLNLAAEAFGGRATESVHLSAFPTGHAALIDEDLSARMNLMREIVSLGRSARMAAALKVRQPLAKVEVILTDRSHQPWLEEHAALICEELNVKEVDFAPAADQYITYMVLPELKQLGPKFGKRLPAVKKAIGEANAASLLDQITRTGQVELSLPEGPVTLDAAELQVRLQAKPGWAAAHSPCGVVVLSTEITPDLAAEGLARELVHALQTRRKELNCEYTDRLEVGLVSESTELIAATRQFASYIAKETLADKLDCQPIAVVEGCELKLAGHVLTLYVKRLPQTSLRKGP